LRRFCAVSRQLFARNEKTIKNGEVILNLWIFL
jgi:hypothetical protein